MSLRLNSIMIILSIVFLLLFISVDSKNGNDDKLVFVQVVFRHGSRTIHSSYPKDPYHSKKYWPQGFGQLTPKGKQQEYELGQFLFRRYNKFLGAHPRNKVYTVSSQFHRTIDSANLVLDGLFPKRPTMSKNSHPNSVHVLSKKTDHLLKHRPACTRYRKELEDFIKSPKIKTITHQYHHLFRSLSHHSGKSIHSIEDVKRLHDTLSVERYLNLPLPKWAQRNYKSMENFGVFWLKLITGTTKLQRLYSGFLLKDILDRFKKKSNSKTDLSMYLYAGHDVTIAGILNTLGVFQPHIPPYSSSLLFELYESNGHYYIQLLYRHSNTENPAPIYIPHCGVKCSLNKFRDLYSAILPSSFDKECRLHK